MYRSPRLKNFHIYNQYVIRVQERDALRKHLSEKEVGTEIYYPVPFHRQECFASQKNVDRDFPISNHACEKSLALPIYPELAIEQIIHVIDSIADFVKNH